MPSTSMSASVPIAPPSSWLRLRLTTSIGHARRKMGRHSRPHNLLELRQVNYLNNMLEQDHRSIKRLVKPGLGFFSLETAWRTLQGDEVISMMRKGQMQGVAKGESTGQIAFIARLFGVAASTGRQALLSVPRISSPVFATEPQFALAAALERACPIAG